MTFIVLEFENYNDKKVVPSDSKMTIGIGAFSINT